MKLQILIPYYGEGVEVLRNMLNSIALQQQINFDELGVIICNDGGEKISQEIFNSYPFERQYYDCPHQGVSATRNECLKRAGAEYVMFCDADDMFYNMCGLWIIFREISLEPFDTLVSCFTEETKNPENDEFVYNICSW